MSTSCGAGLTVEPLVLNQSLLMPRLFLPQASCRPPTHRPIASRAAYGPRALVHRKAATAQLDARRTA
eukprot:298655-Alexandrium_andersonii.AAC.1